MQFKINSKTLLGAVAAAAKVVNPKSVLPILTAVRCDVDSDLLTLTCTDTENRVRLTLPIEDAQGASFSGCIEARRLQDVLKSLPDCLLDVDCDEATLQVTLHYTSGCCRLPAISSATFPEVSATDNSEEVCELTLDASALREALAKVAFAVGDDDLRPQMKGVNCVLGPTAAVFAATDTRKLAKFRTTRLTNPDGERSFTLPTAAVSLLSALLSGGKEVKVRISPRNVLFTGPSYQLSAQLVKGNFPAYDRVIPTDNDKVANLDRLELLAAMRRVGVCGEQSVGLVVMAFSDGKVVLTSRDPGHSTSGTSTIDCQYVGEPLTIGFSSIYLGDTLGALETPRVVIKLATAMRPALVLPSENVEGGELTTLCTPMVFEGI